MKKMVILAVAMVTIMSTGCGEAPTPSITTPGVETVLVENVEVEDILIEDTEVEEVIEEQVSEDVDDEWVYRETMHSRDESEALEVYDNTKTGQIKLRIIDMESSEVEERITSTDSSYYDELVYNGGFR